MAKVMCIKCKDIGYTASPNYVRCQCGGQLVVITEQDKEVKEHESLAYTAK